MSFDLILPFLRPIAHLIHDPDVSEIMVNAGGRVFLERDGVLLEAPDLHLEERNLHVAVRNIARTLFTHIEILAYWVRSPPPALT
jgi:pilus assembly protein CpaF